MIGNENEMAERCTYCSGRRRVKPIVRRSELDDPVGGLCLGCYSMWVQLTDYEEECVICGEGSEYCTPRDLEDLAGEPITAPGLLEFCETHIGEFAVRV